MKICRVLLAVSSYLIFSCSATSNREVDKVALQEYERFMGSDSLFNAEGQNCLACHQGIMPARDHNSPMMQQIYKRGEQFGDPNGSIVCHGGDPLQEIM